MGDDPSLRRTFIEDNAYKVKELDVWWNCHILWLR
jgi:DNA gyrase subunit B